MFWLKENRTKYSNHIEKIACLFSFSTLKNCLMCDGCRPIGFVLMLRRFDAPASITCIGRKQNDQVYIYGCADATIDIKGKCKMVAIDGCKKTQV